MHEHVTSITLSVYNCSADIWIFLQVFDDCHESGEISPSNCIYMTEWLEF